MKKLFCILTLISACLAGSAQSVSVPDKAFLEFLKQKHPKVINSDNELDTDSAATITALNCSSSGITNLDGIKYFTILETLNISQNNINQLPGLDELTNLKVLYAKEANLSALPDLSLPGSLKKLVINSNNLSTLPDLSQNQQLKEIEAGENQLTDIGEISSLSNLTHLKVENNMISQLPDMSNLNSLRFLYCQGNLLTSLPDLSRTDLDILDVSNNKITEAPDLSFIYTLDEVHLNNNYLTEAPNLSDSDWLQKVDLRNNYLSFSDFYRYRHKHDFRRIFRIEPQKAFKINSDTSVLVGSRLVLSTGIDQHISKVSYKWYKDGDFLRKTDTDALVFPETGPSDEGNYYCKIEYSGRSLDHIDLYTDTFAVRITQCVDISTLSYSVKDMSCTEEGSISIDSTSFPGAGSVGFTLQSVLTRENTFYDNNFTLSGLDEKKYYLIVEDPKGCRKQVPGIIHIDNTCEDIYITPNGDGDNDTYFISYSGKGEIYDTAGNLLGELNLPQEWDATVSSGLLKPGYYMIKINEGQAYITISVLY